MEVTVPELRGLYDFLNLLLFNGVLSRPSIRVGPVGPRVRRILGEAPLAYYWPSEAARGVYIHINPELHTSLDEIVGTLAHEMAHHLQHTLGLELDHGDFFQGYADACRDRLEIDV